MVNEQEEEVWELRLTDRERRELMEMLEAVKDAGISLRPSDDEDFMGCGRSRRCLPVLLGLHFFHYKMRQYAFGAMGLLRKLEELPLMDDGG